MARRRKLSEGKRNVIAGLITLCDVKTHNITQYSLKCKILTNFAFNIKKTEFVNSIFLTNSVFQNQNIFLSSKNITILYNKQAEFIKLN